jgi:hypothetical protein
MVADVDRQVVVDRALGDALQPFDLDVVHREISKRRRRRRRCLREHECAGREKCQAGEQRRGFAKAPGAHCRRATLDRSNSPRAPSDASAIRTRGCAPLHVLTTVSLSTSA